MLPSSTHLMPVIGLDLHLATSGNPFHPYVGMVIDPFDYIPFLGSNVNINGLKCGVSDTSGVLITFRHTPLVGAFIMMPIIGHESMNFFSSQTVFAEGTRLSPKGYMVMICNDVGIPCSGALSKVGKKKFKFTPTLVAPTSFSIPIPTGAPVMVGGPYAPDWGGMLTGLLSSIGLSTLLCFAPAILKAMKKAGKKGLTAFNHKVLKKGICKKMRATRSLSKKLCKHGFEPVNLVNGVVVYEGEDFFFPGMFPKKDASDLIHHSDRGTQYTSRQYTNMLNKRGIQISMTESGDSKENSQSERINSTTKNEFLKGKVFRSIDEANRAISKAIETYNTIRPHISIDYMTPQEARECTGPLKKRWRSYREDAIQKARKDKESKGLVTS